MQGLSGSNLSVKLVHSVSLSFLLMASLESDKSMIIIDVLMLLLCSISD